MNFVGQEIQGAIRGVGIANDPASLDIFINPGGAAAIWRRQTPPDVQNWLDRLAPVVLPRGRVILSPKAVKPAVTHLCDISGLPDGLEWEWLQDDIAYLSEMFSGLMSARHLRLRLDVVNTNACRKFHIDTITARLVCTYRGTGTQYGVLGGETDPKQVFTVQTGAPILLRGRLWPEQPTSGLLHRSPPIEGTGETRLVLVLDPVDDLQGEA